MIYYVLGLIGSLLVIVEGLTKNKKFSIAGARFFLVLLLLLAGLRHEVGTDWYNYVDFYNGVVPSSIELGYKYVNDIFKSLEIHYNIFLIFLNSISLTLFLLFLRKNTPLLIIGFLIYFSDLFLYLNLSGIRQAIALSLTSFSINYIIRKDFLKFLLIVIIASSFHLTALLFIIAYFLPKNRIDKSSILKLSLFAIIGIVFMEIILEFLINTGIKNAEFYILFDEKPTNLNNLFLIGVAKRLVPIFLLVLFGYKWIRTQNSTLFINLYLVGLIIYILTYKISPNIGVRLSAYFTITELIIIPNILYVLRDKINRILVLSIIIGITFYKLYGYSVSETYVYKTIFNQVSQIN